jgi:predicted porin
MNPMRFAVLAAGLLAGSVHAQSALPRYGLESGPPLPPPRFDISSLEEPGMAASATEVFGLPGKRMGLEDVGIGPERRDFDRVDREARRNRAWGISLGVEFGPLGLRAAHQNKSVARIAPSTNLTGPLDARNSLLAANLDIGIGKVYAAYSANRGWGSSPLFNPDNPYSASMGATPSRDSRDVLVGLAIPLRGSSTFLMSYGKKNDRDPADRDATQFAVGATYAVSRKTDFYAAWSRTQFRRGAGIPIDPASGSSALNIGMRHAF